LSFAYNDPSKLLLTSDGGVFMFDRTASKWFNMNGNIATAEINGLAYDPVSDGYVACLQDNGCVQSVSGKYKADGLFAQVSGSDGINAEVDLNDVSSSYPSSRMYFHSQLMSQFRGAYLIDPSNSTFYSIGLDKSTNGIVMSSSPNTNDFYSVLKVNKCAKGVLLSCSASSWTSSMIVDKAGTSDWSQISAAWFAKYPNLQGLYGPSCVAFTPTPTESTPFNSVLLASGRFMSAVYGGKSSSGNCNANMLVAVGFQQYVTGDSVWSYTVRDAPWAIDNDFVYYKTLNPYPKVAVNPANYNEIAVSSSGPDSVWYSSDFGVTFKNVYGDLESSGIFTEGPYVNSIAIFGTKARGNMAATTAIVAGTRSGPKVMFTNNPGKWLSAANQLNFPFVPINVLNYDELTDSLHAATMGRGIYRLSTVSAVLPCVVNQDCDLVVDTNASSLSMSTGAIIGISVGAAVCVIAGVAAIIFWCKAHSSTSASNNVVTKTAQEMNVDQVEVQMT
jgi:hypothetical protein